MAERRGGYRKPGGGVRTSGVGKNSQRTDANQPIRVENVQDSTDLTHGDRQKLEAGQRIQPIGRAPTPSMQAAPRGGLPTAAGGAGGDIPSYLMEMGTNRTDEPITEGLPFGPGGGPEVLESFRQPTEKQQLAQFMASRPGASPRWQAVLSAQSDEMRAPEMPAEPMLSLEPETEEPMIPEEEGLPEDIAPDLPPEELNVPEEAIE